MNPFSRLKNLINIQKAYGYLRDLKEKPELRSDTKFLVKFSESLLAIKEVQEMLQGYKTYIVAGLIALASAAKYLGYLDENAYEVLITALGAGALGTMAAKVNRIANK